MTDPLPNSAQQMRWLLARRLGAAVLVICLLAGAAAFMFEARRAEQAALETAEAAAAHFVSPAMQAMSPGESGHKHLRDLLDGSHFIGIRVFDQSGNWAYEVWDESSNRIATTTLPSRPTWPPMGESRRTWISVAQDGLIQVVLPLAGGDGRLVGYIEGFYRLAPEVLLHQREQIRNGVLMAAVSALATGVALYPLLLSMFGHATALSDRLMNANFSLVHALGKSIAKRDIDTDAHNYRVTLYAAALAEEMGVSPNEIPHLVIGAFLHDVGKIGIPDHILQKPGRLSAEEFEVMKTHTLMGLEIIAGIHWLEGAAEVIRHHHERIDGKGYPDRLAGEEISLHARIFAVVDVFDALVSARPYKAAISPSEALAILEREAMQHFDADVVNAFNRIALSLHGEVARATEADLHRAIRPLWLRCFKKETAPQEPFRKSITR
ncbi:MAG: HD-GYP domain-containing protein [Nitrospira sp.]|nr:HD-GYP domain-containing protein [Nitrospira sp.]